MSVRDWDKGRKDSKWEQEVSMGAGAIAALVLAPGGSCSAGLKGLSATTIVALGQTTHNARRVASEGRQAGRLMGWLPIDRLEG